MGGVADLYLRGLRGALLDFDVQLLKAAGKFRGALPVEENAILAAVKFERRLAQDVLVLPQLAFKLVGARREPLLFSFPLIHGLRFLGFLLRNPANEPR